MLGPEVPQPEGGIYTAMMSAVAAGRGVHRRESVPGHGLEKRYGHYTGGCGLSLPYRD